MALIVLKWSGVTVPYYTLVAVSSGYGLGYWYRSPSHPSLATGTEQCGPRPLWKNVRIISLKSLSSPTGGAQAVIKSSGRTVPRFPVRKNLPLRSVILAYLWLSSEWDFLFCFGWDESQSLMSEITIAGRFLHVWTDVVQGTHPRASIRMGMIVSHWWIILNNTKTISPVGGVQKMASFDENLLILSYE